MTTQFKVGDRVRTYGRETGMCDGTVLAVDMAGLALLVELDDSDLDGNIRKIKFYPQQCRRLKPKHKARDMWESTISRAQTSHEPTDEHNWIHWREVLPKRVKS